MSLVHLPLYAVSIECNREGVGYRYAWIRILKDPHSWVFKRFPINFVHIVVHTMLFFTLLE